MTPLVLAGTFDFFFQYKWTKMYNYFAPKRQSYRQYCRPMTKGHNCIYNQRGVGPGGGYSHVKAYGDVPPKWVTFSAKILRHGSHFGQKNPKKRVPFRKNREKMIKSAILR